MNHALIDQIAIQAGLVCDGTDFDQQAVREFAKLIILECADQLYWEPGGYDGYQKLRDIADKIKGHT